MLLEICDADIACASVENPTREHVNFWGDLDTQEVVHGDILAIRFQKYLLSRELSNCNLAVEDEGLVCWFLATG